MKRKTKLAISTIVFGIIGSFYTFVPYKTVKAFGLLAIPIKQRKLPDGTIIWDVLRHNDHVMIGTIALIIAIASLYALIRNKSK